MKKYAVKKWAMALAVGALTALNPTAFAEQPAAEQYRQMFRSGDFYVEYGRSNVQKFVVLEPGTPLTHGNKITKDQHKAPAAYLIIAERSGKRMHGVFGRGVIMDFTRNIIQLPKAKKTPDVLYAGGKYYRAVSESPQVQSPFFKKNTKITVRVLPENLLGSPLLDPRDNWSNVRKDLALPEELAIFDWYDSFRDLASDAEAPHFTESSQQTVNGRVYDCDDYVLDKKAAPSGTVISQTVYRAFYEAGNLVYVQKLFACNGAEELQGMIDVRKIESNAPEELFSFPAGTKLYAAESGDMDDLTGDAVLLKKIGKPSKS